jgi:hypothetical protein
VLRRQIGIPQPPPGVTRFRVTFTKPGVFNHKCALHDGFPHFDRQSRVLWRSHGHHITPTGLGFVEALICGFEQLDGG